MLKPGPSVHSPLQIRQNIFLFPERATKERRGERKEARAHELRVELERNANESEKKKKGEKMKQKKKRERKKERNEGDEGEERKRRKDKGEEKLRKAVDAIKARLWRKVLSPRSPHANFRAALVRQPFLFDTGYYGPWETKRERERGGRAFGHCDELNQAIRRHVRRDERDLSSCHCWSIIGDGGSMFEDRLNARAESTGREEEEYE